MATAALTLTGGLSRGRRTKDRVFTGLLWASAVVAMLPLAFIAFYVVTRGVAALHTSFFTQTPNPPGVTGGGISEAFIGTGIIVGLGTLFSVPIGVLAAVYLAEYGHGRLASAIRFVAEILLSTPSIVAGAFIWSLVVVTLGNFSALAGALARPVFTALPAVADWRWLIGRDDTPWYPTMRLFRQNAGRQWQPVMARVTEAVVKKAAAGGA